MLILGCSKEIELEKSVFQPDNELVGLPAYSEWGYNTFGAYYDRSIFVSNDQNIPVKVITTDGKTSFRLHGQLQRNDNYYGYQDMKMTFILNGFLPETYEDLLQLNNTIIDLQSPDNDVIITINGMDINAHIFKGFVQFKRAQYLLVDSKPVDVILSGYFGFQALIDEEPVTFSNGRFDLGVGETNFFSYQL